MKWTLAVAIYGAVTGTVGAVAALRARRDITWGRRAKVAADVRPVLVRLRDVLVEAGARPERASALASPRTRAELELLSNIQSRTADRRLRRQLDKTCTACAVAATARGASQAVTYRTTQSIQSALAAVTSTLDRLDKIERKAPK